jgi:hypothetical protein
MFMSQEYYSVLGRTISAVAQDHAQLRGIIYRLARIELQRELRRRYKIELQQQTSALEKAIAQIESDFVGDTASAQLASQEAVDHVTEENSARNALTVWHSSRGECEVLSPIVYPSPDADRNWSRLQTDSNEPPRAKQAHASLWWNIQIAVAAIAGIAIYFLGQAQGDFRSLISRYARFEMAIGKHSESGSKQAAAAPTNTASVQPMINGVPLPNSYGVYALNRAKLIDLGLLPIRVPDPRVAISAMISAPSQTVLPDGHLQFIVFRRDLVNDAPDRVEVRVVARVMRALTFTPDGKATLVNVNGAWAVRGNAYEMKVAPISGRPEMIIIRPANPDFIFPAGRYALVLKRSAYDFSVDGPITDVAQCLERTDALDVAVYSECRKPQNLGGG